MLNQQSAYNLCDSSLRQYPRKFPLPKLTTNLPFKRNPLSVTNVTETERACEWMRPMSMVKDQKYHIIKTTGSALTYLFPECTNPEKYAEVIKYIIALIVLDDHNEFSWGDVGRDPRKCSMFFVQYFDAMDKLVDPKHHARMSDWPAYILAFYAICEPITREYDVKQTRRFVQGLKMYANGVISENVHVELGNTFKSIERYKDFRYKGGAALPTIQLIEYVKNINLNNSDWELLQPFIKLCGEHALLINDFFSFDKEYAQENGNIRTMFNCGAVIMQLENCSEVDCLIKLAKLITDYESKIIEMYEDIVTNMKWNRPSRVRVFVDSLIYFVGGNYKMNAIFDRNNKFVSN